MKKTIAIFLLIAIVGCKKKDVTPVTTPTPVCETKTKLFEGKYVSNAQSHDTISVAFSHNNCPTENSNNYLVYGLGKALKHTGTSIVVDTVKVFTITSNELQKNATTNSTSCQWGFTAMGDLSCSYQYITPLLFTKIN